MAVPSEMLLHPELLSNDQLMGIIQERHLRVPNIEIMSRDELLDLFHNFCVPFGQRKYRDTGRGKILNKVRDRSPDHVIKLNIIDNNKYNICHTESIDRHKPPPDMLSGHVKRMRLDTKPSNIGPNVNKRKMSVDADKTLEIPPRKKERKVITWP